MSTLDRKSMERTADRLGIPWTLQTSDTDLKEAIDSRDKEEPTRTSEPMATKLTEVGGIWFFNGDEKQPECFGLLWDCEVEECDGCNFEGVCISSFVNTTLKEAVKAVGQNPNTLAEHLEISVTSIEQALPLLKPVKKKSKKKKKVTKKKKKVVTTKPKVTKKKKPEVPKEKPPKKKKAKEVPAESRPTQAVSSVTTAGDAAKPQKSRFANTAQEWEGETQYQRKWAWGEKTFERRSNRERKRHKVIGRIPPGTILAVTRKGQNYRCKMLKVGVKYQNIIYPTLQATTNAATGMIEYPKQVKLTGKRYKGTRLMGNWSAKKFWKLEKQKQSKR